MKHSKRRISLANPFRLLKEKEEELYGAYRTRRLA
jgi:hypothetical protein